jgi:NADH-quinone oxidoreductase subunit F
MNIPRFLQLLSEDKFDEAFESVLLDNPLPAITGRVCEHPCSTRCRRAELDEAVGMREVHRYIVDTMYSGDHYEKALKRILGRKFAPTGKRIAIIGAGPAGLTAAFYLLLLGHDVTLYDLWPKPGGILRWAIPQYRIPHDVLNRELDVIERLGVRFIGNTRVSRDITLDDLKQEFDALFLAIGAGKGLSPGIKGEELQGVFPGISFLEKYAAGEPVGLGRQVVVIGGGNVAIDSARTCRRLGAEVTVVYRRGREDMPAIAEEVEEAEQEGVKFVYMTGINAVMGDENGRVTAIEAVKAVPGDFDVTGRRRPVLTEEVYRLPCDTVILSVGEKVDSAFTKAAQLTVNSDGTVVINEFTFETGIPKVYAGGDLVNGPSNVTEAMATGKKAAEVMDEHLMQQNRWSQLFGEFDYARTAAAEAWKGPRHRAALLPVERRLASFEEVSRGLSAEEARCEARRCLRCDVREI